MSKSKKSGPSSLTMRLHAPGMTILHRAGLGGLAATLRYIESGVRSGAIEPPKTPGAPWRENKPPWKIDPTQITLDLGEIDDGKEFIRRLFELAYQIKDDMIFIPAREGSPELTPEVRAALQEGLFRTFYDHGVQSRKTGPAVVKTCEVDQQIIDYTFRPVEWYKHQKDGSRLIVESFYNSVAISRLYAPGATKRHSCLGNTDITYETDLLLPLLFAPVACPALTASGKFVKFKGKRVFKPGGVLLIPDFVKIDVADKLIRSMMPRTLRETKISSPGDATLSIQIRLKAANMLQRADMAGIRATWHCASEWNSKLQPICKTLYVKSDPAYDKPLERYEIALAELPVRIGTTKDNQKKFLSDSNIRPLIADNLACGHPWYKGFVNLMRGVDPSSKRPRHTKLFFEKGGLHNMIEESKMWSDRGEQAIIHAVHEAIGRRYGQIADASTNPFTRKNRWKGEYERWRLAFSGAKMPNQFRRAFCDLLSRAPGKGSVKENWPVILPWLDDAKWELTRDLSLLALASYKGKGAEEAEVAEVDVLPSEDIKE